MATVINHSKVETKDIAEAVKKGYPVKFVAQKFGISAGTVLNRLKRDGYDKFGNKQ